MRGDQTQNARGSSPAAHADGGGGRVTVEAEEVCLNSRPDLSDSC